MTASPDRPDRTSRRTVHRRTVLAAPAPTTTDASGGAIDVTGDFIELCAVPWGTFTVADKGPDGAVTVFRETWDAASVQVPTRRLRLALQHDVAHLAGVLTHWETRADGLYAYGRLSGSAQDKERVRAYVADGLTQEVSVGFLGSEADEWAPPPTGVRNGLASVRRVGVPLREVSLVHRAALTGAKVLRLSDVDLAAAARRAQGARALAEATEAVRGPVGSRQRFENDARAEHRAALAEREAERRARILAEADAIVPTDVMAARLAPPPPPPGPVVVTPWTGVPDDAVLARKREAFERFQFSGGRDVSALQRYSDASLEAQRRGLE